MSKQVKDLMVPLAEYATVPPWATLLDAVMALKKAQEEFCKDSIHAHRAVLVTDNIEVFGKVSQLDFLSALGKHYKELLQNKHNSRMAHGFLKRNLESDEAFMFDLETACRDNLNKSVKDFMEIPIDGEYIERGASIERAIHMFAIGHHQSLLVVESKHNRKVIGILRLVDVFDQAAEIIQNIDKK